MTRVELEILAEKYQSMADSNHEKYQETFA